MDAHKTRNEGRILAKKDSIGAPGIDEIMRAAKELGLNPTCEDEKMYPKSWWEYKGRVLIDLDDSKRDAMRQIARRIKSMRAQHDS
jgi:signal recognition particle subunit SRP19